MIFLRGTYRDKCLFSYTILILPNWRIYCVECICIATPISTTGYTRKSGIIILLYFVLTSPHSSITTLLVNFGPGGLLKYDLGRDVPLRLKK